jgi:hypothetical protein
MEISDDDEVWKEARRELLESVMCDMTHEEAIFHLIGARLFIAVLAINCLSPDDWEDIKEESPHCKEQLDRAFEYRHLMNWCLHKARKRKRDGI